MGILKHLWVPNRHVRSLAQHDSRRDGTGTLAEKRGYRKLVCQVRHGGQWTISATYRELAAQ